jgi:hypothetical protein
MQVKATRGAIIAPLGTPYSVKNFIGGVNEVKKIKSSVHGEISECVLTNCFVASDLSLSGTIICYAIAYILD